MYVKYRQQAGGVSRILRRRGANSPGEHQHTIYNIFQKTHEIAKIVVRIGSGLSQATRYLWYLDVKYL